MSVYSPLYACSLTHALMHASYRNYHSSSALRAGNNWMAVVNAYV